MVKTNYLNADNSENIRLEKRPLWASLMELALKSWTVKEYAEKLFEVDSLPHHFGWFADTNNALSTISLADKSEEALFKDEIIKKLDEDHFYFERVERWYWYLSERYNQFLYDVYVNSRGGGIWNYDQLVAMMKAFRPVVEKYYAIYDFAYYYGEFVAQYLEERIDDKLKSVVFTTPKSVYKMYDDILAKEIIETDFLDKDVVLRDKLQSYLKLFGYTKGDLSIHSKSQQIFDSVKRSSQKLNKEKELQVKIPHKFYPWVFWLRKLLQYRSLDAYYYTRGDFLFAEVWSQISKKLGVSSDDMLIFLGFDEIVSALEKKQKVKSLISERKKAGVTVAFRSGRVQIYTGIHDNDQKLIDSVVKFNKRKLTMSLKGMTAYKGGVVRAEALVVFSPKDVKIPKGDFILVTPNTDPNFLPIMNKSKGIVTDEGGVLSHAAIMSREFQIPCIVRTGTATDVIKTGMMVTMDTISGRVKVG